MITKGIIEKEIDGKQYQVRIPTLDRLKSSSISSNNLQTASVSSQLNSSMNLSVGDVVFIDFEENSYLNPVILGSLYAQSNLKSKPSIHLNSLTVANDASFPTNTKIGDISYENILCLKNSEKNIQEQLNSLSESFISYMSKIEEQEKKLENCNKNIEEIENVSKAIDDYISKANEIIGNKSDEKNITIFGQLNSLAKGIDKLLSSVGTIDESTTFFERIQDISSRLEELKQSSANVSEHSEYDTGIGENEIYSDEYSTVFDGLINSLRNKFPNGKYWNHMPVKGTGKQYNNQDGWTNTPCTKHNSYCGTSEQTCNGYAPNGVETSWQCMGYANKCGYDMTGYDPETSTKWKKTTDKEYLKKLKKGDIVRYKNNGHSIYITDVNGSYVKYTDCNSDSHCKIKWDMTTTKTNLASSFTYIRISPTDLSKSKLLSPSSIKYYGR